MVLHYSRMFVVVVVVVVVVEVLSLSRDSFDYASSSNYLLGAVDAVVALASANSYSD